MSATAAAVAALAELSSSPLFKKQFPEAAQAYWEKARLGWAFLESAMAKLDAANRDGVVELICQRRNAGAAIVGIFHDADVREAVATRVHEVLPPPSVPPASLAGVST